MAAAAGMDQITVVRIDDTHIPEYHEVEYSVPAEEEEEEEEDVYVIEYSNPEEEGESYKFTMSVDRPLPAKKPVAKTTAFRQNSNAPALRPQRPRQNQRRRRRKRRRRSC